MDRLPHGVRIFGCSLGRFGETHVPTLPRDSEYRPLTAGSHRRALGKSNWVSNHKGHLRQVMIFAGGGLTGIHRQGKMPNWSSRDEKSTKPSPF
ncbi:hypothetical protein MUK42_34637 [Musa troglodytarum]|uniref:Uncharacterized protein n=1 Tax=Musa troglodytarum TaxID=320322 RepID=A0A9E7E902_9LILI|nr:hypothetical protein MUK42_34637 [Musa troglodytarum]